ncbi:MAG: RidA family protein [Solirubrobacteraceae bacterium]
MAALAFFSHSGSDAFEQLQGELARRGLGLDDLLRLRLFAADRADLMAMVEALDRLLERAQWPALSAVELAPHGAATPSLDAIAAPGAHSTRVAVRAPGGRAPGAAHAMRFGPWVFVGAVSAPGSAGLDLPDRIETEARELFAHMQRLLQAGGADLRHVVKVGGWLSFSMSDYEPLAKVRSELLERSSLLPASAAVQTGPIFDLAHPEDGGSSSPAPLLSFEAIAFVPPRPSSKPPHPPLASAAPSPLAPYYASARRAGEYVFTCGEIPRAPAPAEQEARDVCEQLHVHLAEHGALPQDVVQQTVFVRHGDDVASVEHELARWLRADGVATTVAPALDMGFRPGVNVEIEMIAMLARADRR